MGHSYVPPTQRIAVFDNDGTPWSEQPIYFQLSFCTFLHRLRSTDSRVDRQLEIA